MDTTILSQGSFTSTGVTKTLSIRSDVDWIKVYNYTTLKAAGAGTGVEFYWQRGLPAGETIEYKKTVATNALAPSVITTGGINLTDTTVFSFSAPVTVTAVSAAATPVVTTGSTAGLSNGDVVRLSSIVGGKQLEGIDMQIGNINPNVSFELSFMEQIVAANAPGANAVWRKINHDTYWYPRSRYISAVTSLNNQTVVEMTVDSDFTVGQEVRFIVPAAFGMQELNNLTGTITAVGAGVATIAVDINSSSFAPFVYPLTAASPFSPAMVIPVGEAAVGAYANLLDDATINLGLIGVTLAAGVDSPAGVNADVIYWVAGKSFSVNNE